MSSGKISSMLFRHSREGLLNPFLFLSYLEVLDSWLRARSVPRPVLLLLDSLSSFVDIQVMNFSQKYKIVLYGLPASELESVHPVSVGVFSVFKRLLPLEVKKYCVNLGESRNWVELVLREVLSVAEDPVIIRNAFRTTGIFPFVFNTEQSDAPMFVRKKTSYCGETADMIAKLTDPKFVEEFYRSYNMEKKRRDLNYEDLFKIWLTTAVKCQKDNNIIDEHLKFIEDKHLHDIFRPHKCKKVNDVEGKEKEKNGDKGKMGLLCEVNGGLVKLKSIEIPVDNNSSENSTISVYEGSLNTNQYSHTNEFFTHKTVSEINNSLRTSQIYSEFKSIEQSKTKYLKQNPRKRHSQEQYPIRSNKKNNEGLKEQTCKIMHKKSKRSNRNKILHKVEQKNFKNKIVMSDSELDAANKAKISPRILDVKKRKRKAKLFEHYTQQKYLSLTRKTRNRIKKQYQKSYSRNFAEKASNKSVCNKVSSMVFRDSTSFIAPSLEFASSLLCCAIPNISVITNGSKSSTSNTCTITSEINSVVVPSAPLTIVCTPESKCNFTFALPSGFIHQTALDSGVVNGFNEKFSASEWSSFMNFIGSAKTKECTSSNPKTHSNTVVEGNVEDLTKAVKVELGTEQRSAFINTCNNIVGSVVKSEPTTTCVVNPNRSKSIKSSMDPKSTDSGSPSTNSSPVTSDNCQRKLLIQNGEETNLLGSKEKHDPNFTNKSLPNSSSSKINSPLSSGTYDKKEKVLDSKGRYEQCSSGQPVSATSTMIHSSLSGVTPAKQEKLSALSNEDGPNCTMKSVSFKSPLKISSPSTAITSAKHDKILVSDSTATDMSSSKSVPQFASKCVRNSLRKKKRIPYYLTQGPDDKLPITPEELLDVSEPNTLAKPLSNKSLRVSSKKQENHQFDSTQQPKSMKLACGTSSQITSSPISRVGDSKQVKLLEANNKSGPNCTIPVSGTSSPIISSSKLSVGDAKEMHLQDNKYAMINKLATGISPNILVGSPSTLHSTVPQRQSNLLVAQPNASHSTISQVQSKLLVGQANASSTVSQVQSELLVAEPNTSHSTVAQTALGKPNTSHIAGQSYSKIILIPEVGTGSEHIVKYLVPVGKERIHGTNQQVPLSASTYIANSINRAVSTAKMNDKLVSSVNMSNRLENVNYKVVPDHHKSVVFSNPAVRRKVMSTTPILVTNPEQEAAISKPKYVPFFGAGDKQMIMFRNNVSVVQPKEIERSSVRSEVLPSMDVGYQPQQVQTVDHTKGNLRYLQRIPKEILYALKTSNRELLSKLTEGEEEKKQNSEPISTPTFSNVNSISSLANSQENILGNNNKMEYIAGCSEDRPVSCNESNPNIDQRVQEITDKVQQIADKYCRQISSGNILILPDEIFNNVEQSSYKSELSSTVNNSINYPSTFSQREIPYSYGENNFPSKEETFIVPDRVCLQEDKSKKIEIKKEIEIETEIDIQENIKIEEGNFIDKRFKIEIQDEIRTENDIKIEYEIKMENEIKIEI